MRGVTAADRPGTRRGAAAVQRSSAWRRLTPTIGLAAISLLAVAGCGTGQIAQTANQQPSIVGINGSIGNIDLRNVMIEHPAGDRYPAGSDAVLDITVVNSGRSEDELVGATTPLAGNVRLTADAAASTSATPEPSFSGGTASASPSGSATPVPKKAAAKKSPATKASPTQAPPSSVKLPVSTRVALNGAGEHLELQKLTQDVFSGDTVTVRFTFARAGTVSLDVPVATSSTYAPRPTVSDLHAGSAE